MQDKISMIDTQQAESKLCLYVIWRYWKVGVHLGTTFTNENGNNDAINSLLQHLSVLYHDASRSSDLNHSLFVC